MAAYNNFIEGNNRYVQDFKPIRSGQKLVIVTCLDARVQPTKIFGIPEENASIIRNGGGRAKGALSGLLSLQHILGTEGWEIVVLHHTGCGATRFTDAGIRTALQSTEACRASTELTREIAAMEFGAFEGSLAGVEASVREDVAFLAQHPLLNLRALTVTETGSKGEGKGGVVSGWAYDVDTGRVRQII